MKPMTAAKGPMKNTAVMRYLTFFAGTFMPF